MVTYQTVSRKVVREESIKASRFIGVVQPLGTIEEYAGLIDTQRRAHPGANHTCWAYRYGSEMRFSDDGEPGGTAGRPMLEVVLKRDLDRVLVMVTRYFGGTKLGAGGLVRAYSGTVAKALDQAGVTLVEPYRTATLMVPFQISDPVLRFLARWPHLRHTGPSYTADGLVIEVSFKEADLNRLASEIRELTRGRVVLRPETETES
ncbi:MAG: YigZ family protein [Trueperaceae bacterium]|nr:MAG: YigZ family protein [Trueperaceae bacterium]